MNETQLKYQISNNAFRKGINMSRIYLTADVLINLILAAVMCSYLIPSDYSIWPILITILIWVLLFDFGFGSMLKNRVSKFLNMKKAKTGKTYLGRAYVRLGLILGTVHITFLILSRYIIWDDYFNIQHLSNIELNKVVFTIFTFFSARILFSLIGILITNSTIKRELYDRLNLISCILSLLVIYILSIDLSGDLPHFRVTLYAIPLVLFFFCTALIFRKKINHMKSSSDGRY